MQRGAAVGVHGDERLVDLGLLAGRQFDLGFFGGLFQTLQSHLVLGQVDAVFLFELVSKILHDAHVEVFATQEGVAVGRLHFEQAVVDFQDGHVEGTAAKVIDRDGLGVVLVQTIGQRRRGRFVDDPQNFQAGDLAGVLGGLTLGVVEVGRNGDDRLGHFLAQIGLGGFFHLLQGEGRDLRGRVFLTFHFDPCVAVATVNDLVRNNLLVLLDRRIVSATTDQAFHSENGVFRVGDRLAFCRLADQTLFIFEGDDRRRGTRAFSVLDNAGLRAVHDCDTGVGGPEVNPDDFGHNILPLASAMLWRPDPDKACRTPIPKLSRRPPRQCFPAYIRRGQGRCKLVSLWNLEIRIEKSGGKERAAPRPDGPGCESLYRTAGQDRAGIAGRGPSRCDPGRPFVFSDDAVWEANDRTDDLFRPLRLGIG